MLVEYRQDQGEASGETGLQYGPVAGVDELAFLNPNTWQHDAGWEWRIYGDDNAQTWAIVDEIDYHWFVQWRWHINVPHPTRKGNKRYFCRNQSNGARYMPKLYLHVEIMKRTGIEKPTFGHSLVDHRNGNSLDCRRVNLRWATHRMNSLNRFGQNPHDLVEG